MSTITKEFTKEQLQQIEAAAKEVMWPVVWSEKKAREHFSEKITPKVVLELARIALASLEAGPAIHRWRRVTSEPYGPYPWHYGDFIGFSKPVDGIEDEYFYSAPPAPAPVSDEDKVLAEQARAVIHCLDMCGVPSGDYADNEQLQLWGRVIEYGRHPASVSVPAAMEMDDDFDSAFEHGKAVGWNAYRAAMLQGADGNAPAHFRSRPAQSSLSPAQGGNSPVIPDGWVACSERMPEDGEKVLTSFRGGMRTAVCKVVDVLGHKIFVDELTLFNGVPADHWQPLPAAPRQEVK